MGYGLLLCFYQVIWWMTGRWGELKVIRCLVIALDSTLPSSLQLTVVSGDRGPSRTLSTYATFLLELLLAILV